MKFALKILDVFSKEIKVANFLYCLSELSDVCGILCKSHTMLLHVFPDTKISVRQLCSFPFLKCFVLLKTLNQEPRV